MSGLWRYSDNQLDYGAVSIPLQVAANLLLPRLLVGCTEAISNVAFAVHRTCRVFLVGTPCGNIGQCLAHLKSDISHSTADVLRAA